ncbi:three component ABC system middle component [Methylosinus trichosporium]|nr:three component ABC system middle component [Methylosinus trichosporium]
MRKSITGSEETQSIQKVAKYLGKEFARIGDRVTIYATMGVRP